MALISGIAPPNLPVAPRDYEARYQDQFSNALRLFFNAVTNELNSPTPHAAYYDTTTQTNPVGDNVNLFTFNSAFSEFQVGRGTPTSKIYVNDSGVFSFQFAAQLDKTGGSAAEVFLWSRLNGVNVADTCKKLVIQGASNEVIAAWNFYLALQAGDYLELAWQSSDTDVVALAQGPASNYPGIPSVVLNVNWVSNLEQSR